MQHDDAFKVSYGDETEVALRPWRPQSTGSRSARQIVAVCGLHHDALLATIGRVQVRQEATDDEHTQEPASLALVRREVQEAMRAYPRLRRFVDDVEVVPLGAGHVAVYCGGSRMDAGSFGRTSYDRVLFGAASVALAWAEMDEKYEEPPPCPICPVSQTGVCLTCEPKSQGGATPKVVDEPVTPTEHLAPEGYEFHVDHDGDVMVDFEANGSPRRIYYWGPKRAKIYQKYNRNPMHWSGHEAARAHAAHLVGEVPEALDPEATDHGFKVGDRVILGRHREIDGPGSDNWAEDMQAFVGSETVIKRIREDHHGESVAKCAGCDGWWWRLRDMKPAPETHGVVGKGRGHGETRRTFLHTANARRAGRAGSS